MQTFKILVTGDYACFTRPEMKVERVSYDVPTPSAMEGLIKSVYWKPAIRYVIDKIVVCSPVNFMQLKRNEVQKKLQLSEVKKAMNGGEAPAIIADECRHQRSATVLKSVCYGVEFHMELTGNKTEREEFSDVKHGAILRRRLEKGQYFRVPCLGCSEFPVKKIELLPDSFSGYPVDPEIISMGDVDMGYMLYGLNFEDGGIPKNGNWDNPVFSDKADAVYYRPHMVNGVIDVAKYRRNKVC